MQADGLLLRQGRDQSARVNQKAPPLVCCSLYVLMFFISLERFIKLRWEKLAPHKRFATRARDSRSPSPRLTFSRTGLIRSRLACAIGFANSSKQCSKASWKRLCRGRATRLDVEKAVHDLKPPIDHHSVRVKYVLRR